MIIINTVNAQRFSKDGIEYFKNFTPVVAGDTIRLQNTYNDIHLFNSTNYANIEVDGVVYASVALLQSALLPVVYTRDTLGVGGASDFTSLTDTPSDYTGQATKKVVVNATEDGLEFVPDAGVGGESTSDDSNTVTFENVHGKFYNLDSPNGADIVIDGTGAVFGGIAIIYSIGTSKPSITGGTIISDVGTYNTDGVTLNQIFITRDTRGNYFVNIQANSFVGYPIVYETETQNLLDQGTLDGYTLPSILKSNKLNTFIKGLKDNGVYSLLDRLFILDTDGDSDFSRYDVIAPTVAGNVLSVIGTPTFVPSTGWTGAAASSLNTGYNPSIDAVNMLQDSGSIVVYQEGAAATGYFMGVIDSGATTKRTLIGTTTTNLVPAVNDGSSLESSAISDSTIQVNRNDSANTDVFINGASVFSPTNVSTGLPNDDIYILSRNFGGVSTPTDATVGIVMIGGDLTGKESIINSLIQAYIG